MADHNNHGADQMLPPEQVGEGMDVNVRGAFAFHLLANPVRRSHLSLLAPGTTTCPGTSWCFAPPRPVARWRHVAVVVQDGTAQVYLDGVASAAAQGVGSLTASGPLIFGRKRDELGNVGDTLTQFFGLIDDVAVFDRPLAATEVAALAAVPGLTGSETGLVAGWTFDAPLGGLPPVLSQPFSFDGPAYVTNVSGTLDNVADTD